MPRVSIILPTFNRADVIGRAIDSVLAQTVEDFELLVVDDGSTDGTRERIAGLDPRLRVIVQKNQGVAGARNTGLQAARGDLIAFLDSDDAWTPYHLQLAVAFFDAHPGEHLYTSEFWEDFDSGTYVKHFRVETGSWYPLTGQRIGSAAFRGRPSEEDPYLWVYENRTPAGDWARPALRESGYPHPHHYTGNIFPFWRWGWLMAMQPTVITRHALETVGLIDAQWRIASDFDYMARLCRSFRCNMLSVPGCIKHEYGSGKQRLSEDHLVTGSSAVRFHQDVLEMMENLYGTADHPDWEALRGFREYLVGKAALIKGQRKMACDYLARAAAGYPGMDVSALRWLARLSPSGGLASALYRGAVAVHGQRHRIRRIVSKVIGVASP